jgi:hypothetical protein
MEGSTEKSGLSFIPYPGMIALAPPTDIYPSDQLVLSREQYLKQIDDKAQAAVNGELVVAATGRGIEFVEVGDIVSLQNHVRIQKLLIETDNFERPNVFWIIRESEVLCKHDR